MTFLNEDNKILQLLKTDPPLGYKKLFEKYYNQLCAQSYLILQNTNDAEDNVQEIFIKCWREERFQKINQSFIGYLSIAVKHASINALKKRNRSTSHLQSWAFDNIYFENDSSTELNEKIKKVNELVKTLPIQCRKIFELIFMEEKKYKEVAETLDISINTVKTQLKRALAKIRENIKDIDR